MSSVISNPQPNYFIDYSTNSLNQLDNIATTQVAAYQSSNGTPTNLVIGASSNVNVEAVNGVNMTFDSNAAFKLYNYDLTGGNRTDKELLKIEKQAGLTLIQASNATIKVAGGDSMATTTVSLTTLKDSNYNQVLSTPSSNFMFVNPVVLASNITIQGNTFSTSYNIYKTITPVAGNSYKCQVAYSFFVNDYNQLQMVKTTKYGTSNITSVVQNLNVFGQMQGSSNLYISAASNFTVMNNFTA